MNIDWVSQGLKGIIEMALVTHESFCGAGRFWECPNCAVERASLIRSIDMEARLYAAGHPLEAEKEGLTK